VLVLEDSALSGDESLGSVNILLQRRNQLIQFSSALLLKSSFVWDVDDSERLQVAQSYAQLEHLQQQQQGQQWC
jgi:CMP-N-acetylneuraminic acid synthetase